MPLNDGGPAFPIFPAHGNHCDGITIRDYFAAKAMQAFAMEYMVGHLSERDLAANAYTVADAMIAAREGKP